MSIEFVYFDLGNVLVKFSHQVMLEQIGELVQRDPEQVRQAIFEGPLLKQYETGQLTTTEFLESFCEQLQLRPANEADFAKAASNIFELNVEIVPLVVQLDRAGYGLGILSNTCDAHWDWVEKTYPSLIDLFPLKILSFKAGAVKPDAEIFQTAVSQTGLDRNSIVFTDDLAENVDGASSFGLQAVKFKSVRQLARDLREIGLRINY